MEWYLIMLGAGCLVAGFLMEHPKFRERVTNPWVAAQWLREENQIKQTRQQVEKAREDVLVLLEELDRASDKVVQLMTNWAQKAQNQSTPVPNAPVPTLPAAAKPTPKIVDSAQVVKSNITMEIKAPIKDDVKEKYQTVFELAEQGHSVDEIAQLAKIGKGEVQLLLELKNRGE